MPNPNSEALHKEARLKDARKRFRIYKNNVDQKIAEKTVALTTVNAIIIAFETEGRLAEAEALKAKRDDGETRIAAEETFVIGLVGLYLWLRNTKPSSKIDESVIEKAHTDLDNAGKPVEDSGWQDALAALRNGEEGGESA